MIDVGSRISHFKITAKLGEGGMGVVWRAVDERLGREVAIKVLPKELASDPQRRMRFEREASAIAALKHPNIVTIYSLEDDAGLHFIAMELVSGTTLVDLIPKAGLPLPTFLELAGQITEAIGTAHAKGITHRDLKPSNLMVDDDGRVKVLDFGLAKLVEEVSGDDLTAAIGDRTALGQVLGTLAYMSPEQAEGRAVDHRSDVFSLGILLYEMATGRHPFKRNNDVSTLSAILTAAPPPVVGVNGALPPDLGAIIERCLARSPDQRYQSAAELRQDLAALQSREIGASGGVARTPGVLDLMRRPQLAVPAVLLVIGLVMVAAWYVHRGTRQRWARQQALPEIERLVESSPGSGDLNRWHAFALGREAERWIPNDPLLGRLRERYSGPVTVHTDPPGARVLARPYAAVDEVWESLGVTPIDELRVAAGVLQLRIEKAGFEPIEDLYWNSRFANVDPGYILRPTGRSAGGDGVGAGDRAPAPRHGRPRGLAHARRRAPAAPGAGRLLRRPLRGDERRVPALRRCGGLREPRLLARAVPRR